MKAIRLLYVLCALPLPSCLIYDASLLAAEDDNASTGGSPQDDDGAGTGGELSGSGGNGNVGGGTTGGSNSGGGPSTGGAAATGGAGSGGTGGTAPVCDTAVGTTGPFAGVGATMLVEDFDHNGKYLQDSADENLTGSWYVGVDSSAGATGITPANDNWVYEQDPCLDAGNKSMHVGGTGYVAWGASFDAALKADNAIYDASAHKGVVFWARVASGSQVIKIAFTDGDGPTETSPRTLTTVWTQYQANFPAAIDASKLKLISIVSVGQASFDFWIDDLTFYQVP